MPDDSYETINEEEESKHPRKRRKVATAEVPAGPVVDAAHLMQQADSLSTPSLATGASGPASELQRAGSSVDDAIEID